MATKWDDEDFAPYRDAFPEEHRASPAHLQAHVEDLTMRDVKIAYLKNLQGLLWENGYTSSAYSTTLFPDVAPQLRQWKQDGFELAIYSSGSVFAQKLLFAHVSTASSDLGSRPREDSEVQAKEDGEGGVEQTHNPAASSSNHATTSDDTATHNLNGAVGQSQPSGTTDMTDIFSDWFDTVNAGLKTEATSYTKIAKALKFGPREILFLSDNVKEVEAATAAKMRSIVVDRPGNAPIMAEHEKRLQIVNSLKRIHLPPASGKQ